MKTHRLTLARRFAFHCSAGLIALAPAVCAQPAGYPSKPLRLVTASAPGGGSDFVARILSERLRERLGHPALVDNRPGGGGTIGTDIVAKETADGGAGSTRLGAWMRPGSGL